jgi:hypothetical protein
MPTKPLLTPQQIADKFVNVKNPFCMTEKRAVADIRADLVEYIEMWVASQQPATSNEGVPYGVLANGTYSTPRHIPEIPY